MALSQRGHEAAQPNDGLIIWEVLKNVWNPKKNPSGYVNLGVAENTLTHDLVLKNIHKNLALPAEALTYGDGTSGSAHLRKVMARFLSRQLKPVRQIEPSQIMVTNGCSSAIEQLAWGLGNPGEGFLLGQPYYGTFIQDLSLRTGTSVIEVPFQDLDPMGTDAVKRYEEVLLESQSKGQKVAGLVLCNPHNPLGRCYSKDVIIKYMQLCEKHKIHLISDEIYAFSVFQNTIDKHPPPTPFTSCLSIDTKGKMDPSRLHFVWGMSKDFGANGLRIGAIVSQSNPELIAALVPGSIYSSPSSMADHATANMLADDAWVNWYLATNRNNLAKNYKLVVNWAKENNITYKPGVNAAFFLWVDLGKAYRSHWPDTPTGALNEVVMDALLSQKVFLASGKFFGSENPGWFRIVFSNEKSMLLEGLKRIIKAIEARPNPAKGQDKAKL